MTDLLAFGIGVAGGFVGFSGFIGWKRYRHHRDALREWDELTKKWMNDDA